MYNLRVIRKIMMRYLLSIGNIIDEINLYVIGIEMHFLIIILHLSYLNIPKSVLYIGRNQLLVNKSYLIES